MKGLLVKDCFLLFQRKQSLLMILAVCIFVGMAVGGEFVISYMTILGAIFALSTISYDDADNGMMFLMTLPISKKQYVLSKYVFGFLIILACALLS
ncbi:MAG: ABC-2 transporter permease, partial [Erysipelotrichaceae bacterium]|nr:ABC-2 transporter permease [Erysipelotrichaceae bacterium]